MINQVKCFSVCYIGGRRFTNLQSQSTGVIKSMEVDLYKQQSNMLHQWIQNNNFAAAEKKKPGM
jgi:hypothetical protein